MPSGRLETLPLPLPVGTTVSVFGGIGSNCAIHVLSASMRRDAYTRSSLYEEQSPDHPVKIEVASSGSAIRNTTVPSWYCSVQSLPHSIPPMTRVSTRPLPPPVRCTVSVRSRIRSKRAPHCRRRSTRTVADWPRAPTTQSCVQSMNTEPSAGVAASVTVVPRTYASASPWQSGPQLIPGGSLTTLPRPLPLLETARVSRGMRNSAVQAASAFIVTAVSDAEV